MRLEQSKNTISHFLRILRSAAVRDDDLFIRDTIGAIQAYRQVKGLSPMPHDKAYSAANFILKRLKSNGWQFSPPLMPMVGGVLSGARRKE